ncbi:MAG: ferric reductase-like transmembrane domain-containing protein [Candidatus Goldiibacteriota bacterium]
MAGALLRIFLYAGIVISPALYLLLARAGEEGSFLTELSKGFALTGAMIILMQAVISARIKWMEKAFGFDMVIRFHKYIVVFGGALILLHPLLLALAHNSPELLFSLDLPWYILFGKAALLVIIANILLSILFKKTKVKYETWRITHDILAPVILVFVFIHSFYTAGDIHGTALSVLWPAAFALAGAVFIWHLIIKPAMLYINRPYRVMNVKQEAPGVHTVKMAGKNGKGFSHLPGQFQFIRFFSRGLPREEHHFTISSSPAQGGYTASTIKALGDFTSAVGQLKPGDKAVVDAPYGRFSYVLHPENDIVFIAGGAGITPIMSMLRHMRDTAADKKICLLYSNKNAESIIFRGELEKMAAGALPGFTLVHILEDNSKMKNAEQGRLGFEIINRYCSENAREKAYYICGPAPLISSSAASVRRLGALYSRIHTEAFTFID